MFYQKKINTKLLHFFVQKKFCVYYNSEKNYY